MLARITHRDARLFTRSGKDWTERLSHLASQLKKQKLEGSWLDGEIVVLRDDGRASFQALQNAFELGRDKDIVFYAFDAPYLKGEDLRALPLAERKVGTGFDEHLLETLTRRLSKLKRPDSPLANPPRERGITWVKPQLVCEVAFAERTDDNILRQASFIGLREDIAAKSVALEKAE